MSRDLTGRDRVARSTPGSGEAGWAMTGPRQVQPVHTMKDRLVAAVAARRNSGPRWWADLTGPVNRRTGRKLDALGRCRLAAEGRVIIRRGTRADAYFLIEEGRVAITSPHADHEELGVPTAILEPGHYFGEITGLNHDAPTADGGPASLLRTASIHAVEPCRLRVLRRTEMLTLMELAPEAAVAISRRAAGPAISAERTSVPV